MEIKVSTRKTLTPFTCNWSRNAQTGKLECHWAREAQPTREDVAGSGSGARAR
jgi:hypothetical protein